MTSRTVASTSGAVDTVLTTSTSRMTAAGLKKCMPMTSAGREVADAIAMTGSDDVVVASTAPGLQISSSAAKTACLTDEVLGDGLDDQVGVARARRAVVTPVIRPSAASRSSSVELAAGDALVQRLGDAR